MKNITERVANCPPAFAQETQRELARRLDGVITELQTLRLGALSLGRVDIARALFTLRMHTSDVKEELT
ncbi:MAG TPA: hypothetical protein VNO21_12650 [Polyangiaceae bacterium]|nr:hypothetical protein [Polyangiaceae bacterium]